MKEYKKRDSVSDREESADENDALWDLLGKAPAQRASGSFTQNVLRANRLAMEEKPPSWWSFFSRPAFSLTALAVVVTGVLFFLNTDAGKISESIADAPVEDSAQEAWMEEALLETALEQPDLFTDEELVTMIF